MRKAFYYISLLLIIFSVSAHAKTFKNQQTTSETLKMLDLFGEVFDKVKQDYVEEVADNELVESAINGMLTSLDPHSSYLNEKAFEEMKIQTKGEFGGLGIEVTMDNGLVKVVSPIDDTPAFKAGIKTGDYISYIDDEAVLGMSLTEAVEKMRGKSGTKVNLTILREGKNEPLEFAITRDVIKIKSVRVHAEGDIAYARITSFSEQTAALAQSELLKLKKEIGASFKGVVLDLRNNPGGLLDQAVAVADAFLNAGEIVSTRGRHPDNTTRFSAKPGDIMNKLPIVVIINGGSASASEIVAGALQDHKRAIVIGTRSFGKGSVQSIIPINGHGAIRLTTARYYTPSGKSIQAEGIIPDIIVEPAKLEPLDQKDIKKIYSEANLRKHLSGEQKKHDQSLIKKEAHKLKKKELQKLTEQQNYALYAKDYQLARAIDLLKGIYLFHYSQQ